MKPGENRHEVAGHLKGEDILHGVVRLYEAGIGLGVTDGPGETVTTRLSLGHLQGELHRTQLEILCPARNLLARQSDRFELRNEVREESVEEVEHWHEVSVAGPLGRAS